MTYDERLKHLGMHSLEYRRLLLDIQFVYSCLTGRAEIDANLFTLIEHSRTRGHNLRLRKPVCRTELSRHFLNSRIVNVWDSLPPEVVYADKYCTFLERLHKVDLSRFLQS